MRARAALLTRTGTPFTIVQVDVEEPRDDEVVVEVAAAGLGHTDVLAYDGQLVVPMPAILGREGAGTIVRVGRCVGDLGQGDRVIVSGHPRQIAGHAFGQSLFATHVVVNANNVVPVSSEVPWTVMATLGGEVLASASIIVDTFRPRVGSSLAIFGVGAMGLGALMAAQLAGCHPIIAVDFKASRLELAESIGANMSIDPDGLDPVKAIRSTTNNGVDFSIDTTGVPSVVTSAVDCLAEGGLCALSALAAPDAQLAIEINRLLPDRTICGGLSGDVAQRALIPRLIDLWRRGRFPVDRVIREYPLEDINRAVADITTGVAVKPVLIMH
jgi:aryl-alcohol dehydrogenase